MNAAAPPFRAEEHAAALHHVGANELARLVLGVCLLFGAEPPIGGRGDEGGELGLHRENPVALCEVDVAAVLTAPVCAIGALHAVPEIAELEDARIDLLEAGDGSNREQHGRGLYHAKSLCSDA